MKLKSLLVVLVIVVSQLNAETFVTKKQIEEYKEKYGENAAQRLKNWNNLLEQRQDSSDIQKGRSINKYFNLYRYKYDYKFDVKGNRYKSDFFRSFEDFVGKFGGDCDDYSIVKYHSLLKLGIPEDRLEIWVGGFQSKGINHAVLAFYVDDSNDPLILDSNTRWAVRFSERKNFTPWFYANSLNSGVFDKTLKRYKKQKEFAVYERAADYLMLRIGRWLRLNS